MSIETNKAARIERQKRKEEKQAEKKARYQERVKKRPADYVASSVVKEKPKTSTSTKMFSLFRAVMINHKASKEAEPNVIAKKIERAVTRQYQDHRKAKGNK